MIKEYLTLIQEDLDNFKIAPSKIHGVGVISTKDIPSGIFINTAILPTGLTGLIDKRYQTTLFGANLNHSKDPNAETRKEDGIYKTYSIKDIKVGDEITVDYTVNQDLEQPKIGWKKSG